MSLDQPFHEGERAVQLRAGEADAAVLNSRMIASTILPQALPFLAQQPWAILGGLDAEGQLWCSALMGEPGFVSPNAEGTGVDFDLWRAPLHPENPLRPSLELGRALGGLFIELATRRRLRVNGRVTAFTPEHLSLAVTESFPNCPKFIQKRALAGAVEGQPPLTELRTGSRLEGPEQAWLESADTLFLSTLHPERGVDTSHRGGPQGFVERVDATTLRLPDYPGNSLFQSFGNLAVDDRIGLLVPDFQSGALLHLTGRAQVRWDQADLQHRTGGTGRFLEVRVDRWVVIPPRAGAPRWTFPEASPFHP